MSICGVFPEGAAGLSRVAIEEHGQAVGCTRADDGCVRISYANLCAHAARLDALLPTGCVAVLCEGAAFAVALFALARCGGGRAAVPLNPHDPPARLRVMLEDAKVQVALCQGEAHDLRAALPELEFVQVLVDRLPTPVADAPIVPAKAHPEDLCYVVYTSGSTGRPKGVAVEHRHLRMYCDAINRQTGLSCESRVLIATAVNWDPALSDVARTFLAGGTVLFAEKDRLLQNMHTELQRLRVTDVFATPSWWGLLEGPVDVAGLCGGEPFRPALAQLVPRARNFYGVTEATVAQTLGPEGGSKHAGWSIDPSVVQVQLHSEGDREDEVVMVGPMVARGYWNGDAFDGVFRTGDRGRIDEHGALHVLGRMDQQVKVRGHRVELGEVESALRRIPGIRDAVAVLHGQSLVACCEPELVDPGGGGGWTLGPAAWAAGVAEALPAAFRPAPLLSGPLPRLENGKADRRRALEVVQEFLGGRSGLGGAPRPGVERVVADLWAAVLPSSGVVGRDDNWFALGGTSLAAVHLLRLLPAALLELGLRVDRGVAWCGLHRHPSLHGYAAFLGWAAAAPEAALQDPAQMDMHDPLVTAAGSGDVEACRKLLGSTPADGRWDAEHPCETPLHAAARRGEPAVVDLLLEHRAKLTAGTEAHVLPLHVAAQHGHAAVVDRLLQARAPVDARDWNRWSAIFFVVAGDSLDAAERLIGARCAVNGRDRWGRTTLSCAAARGSAAMVRRLLEARASPGARLQQRLAEKWQADWRPELHHAAPHPDCVALLLAARAPFALDLAGRSALYAAVAAGSAESARLLLAAGCGADAGAAELARGDPRFAELAALLGETDVSQAKAAGQQAASTLLFDIPAWQPAEVKHALRGACGRARVRVASSGQAGVCLGTAVVEADVPTPTLTLRCARGEAVVAVAPASGNELADQAFPGAPLDVRRALQLAAPLPPPGTPALATRLAALVAAGAAPAAAPPGGEATGWAWAQWLAWTPPPARVALVDPGVLGLQLVDAGVPVDVQQACDEWRRSAAALSSAGGVVPAFVPPPPTAELQPAAAAATVVGLASAAAGLPPSAAALLWGWEWPWPEADVELPCPGGVLLVRAGAAGGLGASVAAAWHAAQPWTGSRSARKLWRGGSMGSGRPAAGTAPASPP